MYVRLLLSLLQVTAFASLSWWTVPLGPLRVLAQSAASAAAGGQPLPLQRLVLENGYTLEPDLCHHALAPLFSSLPQLQHLYLHLWASEDSQWTDDSGQKAAVAALAPLRHLTALTSLHLQGPSDTRAEMQADEEGWDAELLACLPSSLARLEWHEPICLYPEELVCDRVTGLTELRLVTTCWDEVRPPVGGFVGLPHLKKLQLYGFDCDVPWLLEHKEVLHGYAPSIGAAQAPGCLGQLVNLRTLDLLHMQCSTMGLAALAAAPQVTQLHLALPYELGSPPAAGAAAAQQAQAAAPARAGPPDGHLAARAWLAPVLAMAGLRALTLVVPRTSSFLPVGMGGLSQLTRLHASFSPTTPGITCSWVCAIERLVNLHVLTVPAVTAACCHQWLTGLTKLGVLELVECTEAAPDNLPWDVNVEYDLEAVAAHLQGLVSTTGPAAAAEAAGAGGSFRASRPQQLQLVCVDARNYEGYPLDDHHCPLYRLLWQRLAGDVALFSGSLGKFLRCGWQLWPQPTAARLQQLLGDMV
jgi:hypothetical protein